MRGRQRKGRKRRRKSKRNHQEYKGRGHLRPQRKKEKHRRTERMRWATQTREGTQNTQRRGPQPSTAFPQRMLTFQAAPLSVDSKSGTPRLVWSEARPCGHSEDGPAAPAPPARSAICENSMSCCCQILQFLKQSQKCGHWVCTKLLCGPNKTFPWTLSVPVLTVWITGKTRLFLCHSPDLGPSLVILLMARHLVSLGQKCVPGRPPTTDAS